VKPPLSTILVDRIKQGFMAAKMLDVMMKFPKTTHAQDYIALPVKVVQRESTAYLSAGTAIIERARKFIEDHATEDIDVNDVARAICISRRLLDLRFQESRMGSVAAMIRTKRLSKVKSLLKQTTLSDSRIAMRCGFKSVGTLRNLFRNTFGMSMRTYRTQH
jgi:LacI family transcriptional regulator